MTFSLETANGIIRSLHEKNKNLHLLSSRHWAHTCLKKENNRHIENNIGALKSLPMYYPWQQQIDGRVGIFVVNMLSMTTIHK